MLAEAERKKKEHKKKIKEIELKFPVYGINGLTAQQINKLGIIYETNTLTNEKIKSLGGTNAA